MPPLDTTHDTLTRAERRADRAGSLSSQALRLSNEHDRHFATLEKLMCRYESAVHEHAMRAHNERATLDQIDASETLSLSLGRTLPRFAELVAQMEYTS